MSDVQLEKKQKESEKNALQSKEQELARDQGTEVETEDDQKMVRAVARVIQSEFRGPIPPPEIISGYEAIIPGAADRILAMAEKQSQHRQEMEKIKMKSESRDGLLGILFAFVLGIGSIIAAIVIVVLVPQNAGAISSALLGMTGIGSIIATFIQATRMEKKDDEE